MKRFHRPGLTYANVVSTLCLFLLLAGGTAFAASRLAKNSVGTGQIKNGAVTQQKISTAAQAALKGARGEAGARGEVGARGEPGPRGLEGPVGPTEGASLSFNEGWTPETVNGQQIKTLTAGKLLAFGHVDLAELECSAPGVEVEAGLFVDGTLVPGTTWTMTGGSKKSLSFAGVTKASVPAGTQEVKWGARCKGAATSIEQSSVENGFGVVVLG